MPVAPHRRASSRVMPGATSTSRAGCACAAARSATTPPKENPASHSARLGPALAPVGDHRERVGDLAAALIVTALARADTAKVEANGRCAELLKRARQRPHHLVVHRAAVAADAGGRSRRRRPASRSALQASRSPMSASSAPAGPAERQPLGVRGLSRQRPAGRRVLRPGEPHQQAIQPLHELGRVGERRALGERRLIVEQLRELRELRPASVRASRYFTSGWPTFTSNTRSRPRGPSGRRRRGCAAWARTDRAHRAPGRPGIP